MTFLSFHQIIGKEGTAG